MRKIAALLVSLLTALSHAQTFSDSNLSVSPYLGAGINDPIALRFTDANAGFVIEKGGAVKRFDGATLSTVLDLSVATNSERGLLGIAIDPGYAQNGYVYLYYSAGSASSWTENRLARYTWNGIALENPTPLATFGTSTDGQANGPNHNGGPLLFGPDGKLYGATGDLNRSGIEQNRSSTTSAYAGGVFRLNADGSLPQDNPFSANTNADVRRWYTYGLRNSFGLAVDPATQRLWNTENGPNSYDEINLLLAGMNSGWTPIMGPDSRDSNSTTDLVMLPGAVYADPEFSFAQPIGITALHFLHGSALGAGYDDAVLVGEVNGGRLWLLRLNAARDGFVLTGSLADGVLDAGDAFAPFGTNFGIVTDMTRGPDGALYVTSYGQDTIFRVAPVPEPGMWALMLLGLAVTAIGFRHRHARQPSASHD
jgi:glucose/arabinose dehydrogenase